MGARKPTIVLALAVAACVLLAVLLSTRWPEPPADPSARGAPVPAAGAAGGPAEEETPPPVAAQEPGPRDVAGAVRDGSGAPIPGATVRALLPEGLVGREILRTLTDIAGEYTIGPIDGVVFLEARADGFATERRRAVAGDRQDFVLGTAGALVGAVIHADGGAPCKDAVVEVWQKHPQRRWQRLPVASTRTDGSGAFRLGDVRPGRYLVLVHPEAATARSRRDVVVVPAAETRLVIRIDPTVTLSGRVLEDDTGRPVPGVALALEHSPRLRTVSDRDGRYRIDGFRRGSPLDPGGGSRPIPLIATVPRGMNLFAPGRGGTVSVPADPRGLDVVFDIRLRRAGAVRGVVLGPDGMPVAGAEVTYLLTNVHGRDDDVVTTTDEQGRFHLTGIPPANWPLYAVKPGLVIIETKRVEILPGRTTEGVVIAAPAGSAVSGRVIDSGGRPVSGARVFFRQNEGGRYSGEPLNPNSQWTDSNGAFRFDGVPARPAWLDVWADGHVKGHAPDLVLEPGGHLRGVKIVLSRGVTISGRVVDGDDRPVPGVAVRIHTDTPPPPLYRHQSHLWSAEPRTDEEGRFVASGMPAVPYKLYVRGMEHVAWSPGDPDPILRFTAGQPEGRLTGRISLSGGGEPRFHRVRISGARYSDTATGNGGEFAFEGLADGTFQLAAAGDPGWLSRPVQVVIAEGRPTAPVHVVLLRGGTVVGRVLGLDGKPGPGYVAFRQAGARTRLNTGADGRFVFGPALPGSYLVSAHRHRAEVRKDIEIVTGEEVEVELAVTAREAIFVEARDADGRHGPPTEVTVTRLEGSEVTRGKTTWSGWGLITAVPPGRYVLDIVAEGYDPVRTEATVPPDGFARVSVALRR